MPDVVPLYTLLPGTQYVGVLSLTAVAAGRTVLPAVAVYGTRVRCSHRENCSTNICSHALILYSDPVQYPQTRARIRTIAGKRARRRLMGRAFGSRQHKVMNKKQKKRFYR